MPARAIDGASRRLLLPEPGKRPTASQRTDLTASVSFRGVTSSWEANLRNLRKARPMTTQTTPVLSAKEQALVGVAMSVANGCKPCTQRYVQAAAEAGACKRGIRLAIESALVARHEATANMALWAESLQGEKPDLDEAFLAPRALWRAIYATGSAYSQHNATGFEAAARGALALGATRPQLMAVLAQSRAMAGAAIGHTEAAFQDLGLKGPSRSEAVEPACGCGCSND